eukprot:TRINITY_DN112532_c0_g1_i1.p1 TRINITY_DN112532_c0_g1~~TRINITY_DN112532_c0_g1_i1.p1  ORF type:complete len:104 (-),score=31.13 TRINITY_DN112532_c0_g1_i1:95-406(-)
MGESFSRSCHACWDPEGVANLVKKKKKQRAAINQYLEVLQKGGDKNMTLQELKGIDVELQHRPPPFWQELKEHDDWPKVVQQRSTMFPDNPIIEIAAAGPVVR